MSGSNERFGRRAAHEDKARAEPKLSFTPRGDNGDAEPTVVRKPAAAKPVRPRPDEKPARPRFEATQRPAVADADRPLYLYMPPDAKRGHAAFGWITLAALGVIAVAGGYAWHLHNAPAPALPQDTGYLTPPGADQGSPPDLAPTQPLATGNGAAPTPAMPAAAAPAAIAPPPAAQAIATPPTPKSVPSEAPPPPRKTISEAASETAGHAPAPPPERAAHDLATAVPQPVKHEAPRTETPRKDTALELPKPHIEAPTHDERPARVEAPTHVETPAPAVATTAAPVLTPPRAIVPPPVPQTFSGPAATGAPLPLSGAAAPAYQNQNATAAPVLHMPQQAPAASLAPAPDASQPPAAGTNGTNTVTVDGVTYVNGEQPHALGTLNGPPPATDASVPPLPTVSVPSTPQPLSATPYTPPSDSSSVAPLPNDVIIQPNGQMTVPSGQQ